MKTFNVVLSVALAGLLSGAAEARPRQAETVDRVVRYADLNLNNPAGIARLHARIRAAARDVCSRVERHNWLALSQARACTEQAVARAVAAVNLPALTRVASNPRLLR